ncbi:MAG TPA: glycosyltransferase [Thermoanaerobaculia bacterium]
MHALAVFALVVWLLAFIQTLVNLRVTPRLDANRSPRHTPLVSIVVPARNEAHIIERSVRAFLAQDYTNIEVIVVNDRSSDETGEILRRIGDLRLTVIDGVEPPAGWLGKTWALQQGSMRASGDLLLFADADLIYAPPAVRAAVEYLESSDAAMAALLPYFEMRTFGEQVGMPMLAFFVFAGFPVWYSNRSNVVGLAIGGGAGNLIRSEVFESIGRFQALQGAIVDDVGLARLARRRGYPTRAVRADDLLSVRMYDGGRAVIDGFTKNAFPVLNRSYGGAAILLALLFVLHLLPYGLALTGDWAAIGVVAVSIMTRVALFQAFRYRLDNAIFLHPLMVVFWAWIMLRSVWVTGIRREIRWRGRTYDAAQTRFGSER